MLCSSHIYARFPFFVNQIASHSFHSIWPIRQWKLLFHQKQLNRTMWPNVWCIRHSDCHFLTWFRDCSSVAHFPFGNRISKNILSRTHLDLFLFLKYKLHWWHPFFIRYDVVCVVCCSSCCSKLFLNWRVQNQIEYIIHVNCLEIRWKCRIFRTFIAKAESTRNKSDKQKRILFLLIHVNMLCSKSPIICWFTFFVFIWSWISAWVREWTIYFSLNKTKKRSTHSNGRKSKCTRRHDEHLFYLSAWRNYTITKARKNHANMPTKIEAVQIGPFVYTDRVNKNLSTARIFQYYLQLIFWQQAKQITTFVIIFN